MMLGEESASATYWKACGDDALKHNVKGIVIMGAHWDAKGYNKVQVAMNPNPPKQPVANVAPSKYKDYKLKPDIPTGRRCIQMLNDAGFEASGNDSFEWIHDVFLILIRMFPDHNTCPPTTIISMNNHYDPHLHVAIGAALRPLRTENYLLLGSGGAVHNLYRNRWSPMLLHKDNFAMETPPEDWALEFRQAFKDVVEKNSGASLRRGLTRLMKHPQYRDSQGTDDHFMSSLFVAGAVGGEEDGKAELKAEDWELTNMCNSQFSWGRYVEASA